MIAAPSSRAAQWIKASRRLVRQFPPYSAGAAMAAALSGAAADRRAGDLRAARESVRWARRLRRVLRHDWRWTGPMADLRRSVERAERDARAVRS